VVLILSGDHIYKMDYRKMNRLSSGEEGGADSGSHSHGSEVVERVRGIEIDPNWRITDFRRNRGARTVHGDSGGILPPWGSTSSTQRFWSDD